MTLETEALTIVHMLGAGLYLGVAVDTYLRILRRKRSSWLGAVQDILFWLFGAVLVFMWLRMVNQGEMRVVIFLALLCGYAFYQAFLQRMYLSLLAVFITVVSTIFRWIWRFFYFCFYRPIALIYLAVLTLLLLTMSLVQKLFHFIFFWLRKMKCLLQRIKKGFSQWMAKWFTRKEK